MGRYRSSGGLDDPVVEDGDGRFVGMNQRLHPSQLGPGEVRLSRNGRIDGYWVPRKGVDVVSSVLDTSGAPLRLPFWLVDEVDGVTDDGVATPGDGALITAASLTGDVVTLTVTGHGLLPASITVTGCESHPLVNGEYLDIGIYEPSGSRLYWNGFYIILRDYLVGKTWVIAERLNAGDFR